MTEPLDVDKTIETPVPAPLDPAVESGPPTDVDSAELVATDEQSPRPEDAPADASDADSTLETPTYTPSGAHRVASRRTAYRPSAALPMCLAAGGIVVAGLTAWPLFTADNATAVPSAATPAPVVAETPPLDTGAMQEALDALSAQAAVLAARTKDAERDAVGVELESDTTLLMQQIRTARDARRKARQRPKLSAPFTAEELAPAADALRLSETRLVTDRQGRVILPASARLPAGADVKSTRRDADRLSVTLEETPTNLTVLARACVPYEQHCLVEVRTLPAPQLSTTPAQEALTQLAASARRPGPPSGDTNITAPAPTSVGERAMSERTRNMFALAAILALVWSLLTFVMIRRNQVAALAPLEQRLWAAASGDPLADQTGPSNGVERALCAVEANIRAAQTEREQQRHEDRTTHVIVSALERATRGDFTARADDERVVALPIARAVNQMLSRTDDRLSQLKRPSADDSDPQADEKSSHQNLMRHLGQLAPLADLLHDVGDRLDVLAAASGGPPPAELKRLAAQVKKRAAVAARLVDILKADAAGLSPASPPVAPLVGVVTSKGPLVELFADNAFSAAA